LPAATSASRVVTVGADTPVTVEEKVIARLFGVEVAMVVSSELLPGSVLSRGRVSSITSGSGAFAS
jgi:hypothetical protein